jgi:hypothetical protein
MGAWCGYVGVSPDNPYAKSYLPRELLSVHGGVTFSRQSEENGLFWIGFDCSHAGDLCPARDLYFPNDIYRPLAYVLAECAALAKQLATAKLDLAPTSFTLSPLGHHLLLMLRDYPWSMVVEQTLAQIISCEITPSPVP